MSRSGRLLSVCSFLALSFELFFAGATAAAAEIAVIVNLKNDSFTNGEPAKNIELAKNIFLGKKREFGGGIPAKPVDQSEDNPLRSDFYLKVADKDENTMKLYWSNLVFTGYGSQPKVLPNDDEVRKYVRENAGAIGYIDSRSADSSVKTVLTLK